jgi:outer membrane protein
MEQEKTMKNLNRWTVACVLLALLGWSTGASAQEFKIGLIDVDQALNATDEGKAALEELKRKKREAEAQLQPLADRHEALKEEIQGKKYVLSEDALFAKQVELAELENKIKSKIEELEGQLKIDQGRMLAPLQLKLKETVEEVGKEQGFTLILQRGNPFIMYSREALDITDTVVSRFNKRG